jgi:hypothetical protein
MGPLSYILSIVDRKVVMRRVSVCVCVFVFVCVCVCVCVCTCKVYLKCLYQLQI